MKWRHDYSLSDEELDRLEEERLPRLLEAIQADAASDRHDDDLPEGLDLPDDEDGVLAVFIPSSGVPETRPPGTVPDPNQESGGPASEGPPRRSDGRSRASTPARGARRRRVARPGRGRA